MQKLYQRILDRIATIETDDKPLKNHYRVLRKAYSECCCVYEVGNCIS